MAARADDFVAQAADAMADLNTFAAIVALLESGLNHAPTHKTAERIIALAKEEQQRCLRRFDAARARANRK